MAVTNNGSTPPTSYRKKLFQAVKKKVLSFKKSLSHFSGRRLAEVKSAEKSIPLFESSSASCESPLNTRKTSITSQKAKTTGSHPAKQEEVKNEQDAFEAITKAAKQLNSDSLKTRVKQKPLQRRKPPTRWNRAANQEKPEAHQPLKPEVRESTEASISTPSPSKGLNPPAIPPKPNRAQSIDSKPSDPIS